MLCARGPPLSFTYCCACGARRPQLKRDPLGATRPQPMSHTDNPPLFATLLVLAGLFACQRSPSPQRVVRSPQAASGAQPDDSVDPSTGLETSCQFSKIMAHPDPRRLGDEFLLKDAAGLFLSSNAWFDGATDCPGHEPGPDTHTAIASYTTSPISSSDTLVVIAVSYQVLGEVHADAQDSSVFEEHGRQLIDTLVIHRTPYGWRVRSPALWLRVLIDSAFAYAKYRPFHAADAQRIRLLLAELKRGA